MTSHIKITRVSLCLTSDGLKFRTREWDAVEKNSIYSIKPDTDANLDKMSGWPEKEKRIKKERFMQPENYTYDTHKMIAYSVWCLPEQVDDAKSKLDSIVRNIAFEIKDGIDKLIANLK